MLPRVFFLSHAWLFFLFARYRTFFLICSHRLLHHDASDHVFFLPATVSRVSMWRDALFLCFAASTSLPFFFLPYLLEERFAARIFFLTTSFFFFFAPDNFVLRSVDNRVLPRNLSFAWARSGPRLMIICCGVGCRNVLIDATRCEFLNLSFFFVSSHVLRFFFFFALFFLTPSGHRVNPTCESVFFFVPARFFARGEQEPALGRFFCSN